MTYELLNYDEDSFGDTEPMDIELGADGSGEMAFDYYSNLFGRRARARRKARRERRRRRRAERRARRRARRERRRARRRARRERKRGGGGGEEGGESGGEEAPSDEPKAEEGSAEGEASTPSEESSQSSESSAPSGEEEWKPKFEEGAEMPPPRRSRDSESSNDNQMEEPMESGQDPDAYVDQETGTSDEEAGYTGDTGFDGVRFPSSADEYYDNFFSADGGKAINPKVKEISRRIEKVKTKINDLTLQLDKFNTRTGKSIDKGEGRVIQYLTNQIKMYQSRLAKLEGMLASYSTFDGDYSEASGMDMGEISRKKAEVRQAKRFARMERKKALRMRRRARVVQLMRKYKQEGLSGKEALIRARKEAFAEIPMLSGKALDVADNVTPVSASLDPAISQDKIKIPPSSSADGTGLIGLDEIGDIDAPEVRNVELEFSNASGTSRKKTWMWVGIGVGVAVLGIVAYAYFRKKKK